MEYENHKQFFDAHADEFVKVIYCHGHSQDITIEELYQHFKSRMAEENKSEQPTGITG